MKIRGFELNDSGKLKPVDTDDAISRWRKGKGLFWFDLQSDNPAELEAELQPLDLPSFLLQRCVNVGEATQIIPLPDSTYLEITVFTDSACSQITNVGTLCLKNLLITIHSTPIHTLDQFRDTADDVSLNQSTTSDLLVALLLVKIEEAAKTARALRTSIEKLDDRMDRDPDSVDLGEILDAKQTVSQLVAVSEEQEECFDILATASSKVLDFSKLQGPLKLLTSLAGSVNRRADRLATGVADLRQRYGMNQEDRTNHRLAILTAAIMTWFFYKRGWLK